MFFSWLQNLLGQWGMATLNFYETNSLWINLIVLAYGFWIILSWVNLKKVRSTIIRSLVIQMQAQPDMPKGTKEKATPLVIPWESAISQVRFPFVAQQSALLPRRLSIQAVQSLLPEDDLVADARDILKPRGKKKK